MFWTTIPISLSYQGLEHLEVTKFVKAALTQTHTQLSEVWACSVGMKCYSEENRKPGWGMEWNLPQEGMAGWNSERATLQHFAAGITCALLRYVGFLQ